MSLPLLRARLGDVYDAVRSFSVPLPQLPVIAHDTDDKEALPGLRLLREEVKRDCDALDRLSREHAGSAALSTNAPYLIAVWDELAHARRPVAIYRTFSPANGRDKTEKGTTPALKGRTRPVKVDVVAENGAQWVRVNTIKNARLVMEFREMDSYLTSDDDGDSPRPRLAQTEFDNPLLKMGRELLAAARANPVSVPTVLPGLVTASSVNTAMAPRVTIRLTRLDPSPEDDPRIEKTIQCLRDMGIEVQLGERSYPYATPIPRTSTRWLLEPTTDINLDLSALIALISDISHSSLPLTEQEAYTRFEPPQSYIDWKNDRAKLLAHHGHGVHPSMYDVDEGGDDEGVWENSGQHSRALAAQVIQEMNKGLLEEIHERISTVVMHSSTPSTSVTFWTTSEARHRCLQIVSKIGGERERQRADALLGSTCCSRIPPVPASARIRMDGVPRPNGVPAATSGMDNAEGNIPADGYWGHSRYPPGFLPLVPVHIYPSVLPTVEADDYQFRTTFCDVLMRTCTGILSHEVVRVSQMSAPSDLPTNEQALEEILPAMRTAIPKLTVHTVASMLAGASRGYTTLTTNRSSVKAVFKEMRRVCGGSGYDSETRDVEKAAMWIVEPRSLSEGMRSE